MVPLISVNVTYWYKSGIGLPPEVSYLLTARDTGTEECNVCISLENDTFGRSNIPSHWLSDTSCEMREKVNPFGHSTHFLLAISEIVQCSLTSPVPNRVRSLFIYTIFRIDQDYSRVLA
jgi:hypothetical protein